MFAEIGARLKHAWNVFRANERQEGRTAYQDTGISSSYNYSRPKLSVGNERSIVTAVCTRVAIDIAAFDITHARVNEDKIYQETLKSNLNNCLTVEANIDQTGRAFIQDVAMSMFDEGSVAIVPIETSVPPTVSGSYEIYSMRTGKIVEWYPSHVRVDVYNERTGLRERIIVEKARVCIIENPLYAIMNEPNSTMKRLISKLNILDAIDQQSGSGKLDIIIRLPYAIKTEKKEKQAEARRIALEKQLSGSRYGIGYMDATENITQLNRPSENNLLAQIKYLTEMLYSQLGITEKVFNGTAGEEAMANYYDRTIEPLVMAITEELNRKFLSKGDREKGHTILAFRNVLKLLPASEMSKMVESLSRNEIVSSNEFRSVLGLKPSKDPKADKLENKNMPKYKTEETEEVEELEETEEIETDEVDENE